MINKLKNSTKLRGASKFFTSVLLTGGMLLFVLKPAVSRDNAELKAELMKTLKEHSVKEWKIMENDQYTEKAAKFETLGGNDTLKDPYDQIREYVEAQDTAYFNQLRTHMESKDSTEQIKCKAVVYAILQDTILTAEQKKILALGQFERLAKMPGSDYRFSKKSSQITTTDPTYKSRANRYGAYKSYLELLDLETEIQKLQAQGEELDEQIKNLDEQNKNLDEQIKNLDEQNKNLDEQIKNLDKVLQLLQQLLDGYTPSK